MPRFSPLFISFKFNSAVNNRFIANSRHSESAVRKAFPLRKNLLNGGHHGAHIARTVSIAHFGAREPEFFKGALAYEDPANFGSG